MALRLMVAHAIVGSTLFRVSPEPQRAHSDAIGESVETCPSEAVFDVRCRAALNLIGLRPEVPTVIGGYEGEHGLAGLFTRLLTLSDQASLDILAVVMAEALEAGSVIVEALGQLSIDMANVWQPDEALLALIKDREVLDRILPKLRGRRRRRPMRRRMAGGSGASSATASAERMTGPRWTDRCRDGWRSRQPRTPCAAASARSAAEQIAGLMTAAAPDTAALPADLAQAA
ncbi:MAG TPA: hypothetical protein VF631_07725 [Allosphingosinicella sp.]